jgi:hypothetical protein
MCHSTQRLVTCVLVAQLVAAAAPLHVHARQDRARRAVFTPHALKQALTRVEPSPQADEAEKRRHAQWTSVRKLDRGARILIAAGGQALAHRSVFEVLDNAIVLDASRGMTERITRDAIDQIVIPSHGSEPAAAALGFLGFFIGFAAAATSAPNKPTAIGVMIGIPTLFGLAGYHGLRSRPNVIYER